MLLGSLLDPCRVRCCPQPPCRLFSADLSPGLFLHHRRAVSSPSPAWPGMLQGPGAQSNLSSSQGELLHTISRATASPRPCLQPSDSADLRCDMSRPSSFLPQSPASGPLDWLSPLPGASLPLWPLKMKRLSCFETGPRGKMVTPSFVIVRISALLEFTNSGQAFVGAGEAECREWQEPRRPESVTPHPHLHPGTVCSAETVTSSSPASWADLQVR